MDKELYNRVAYAMLGAALLPLVKSVEWANDARKELLSRSQKSDSKTQVDLERIRNGLEEILHYVTVVCDFIAPTLDCDTMEEACKTAVGLIQKIEEEYQ